MYDELTPKERKQVNEHLGFFSAFVLGIIIIGVSSFVIDQGFQQMFAFGIGMLIRPLASKMTKLIERK
tara:strand:- start:4742 stop:4945 length:204 start_codon:yes stop_codon:yes gene_type:complete